MPPVSDLDVDRDAGKDYKTNIAGNFFILKKKTNTYFLR